MRSFNKIILILILIGALLVLSAFYQKNKQQTIPVQNITTSQTETVQVGSPSAHVLGVRTKSSNCVSQNAMPDKNCTPGQAFPEVTKDQICVPGYSKSVRNVPEIEKKEVYSEYGIYSHTTGEYEVDHLISLELGGSNDVSNLWPEPAEPRPGFHEKDKVENYLHDQVCNGSISLLQAQEEISSDWLGVYKQMGQ